MCVCVCVCEYSDRKRRVRNKEEGKKKGKHDGGWNDKRGSEGRAESLEEIQIKEQRR